NAQPHGAPRSTSSASYLYHSRNGHPGPGAGSPNATPHAYASHAPASSYKATACSADSPSARTPKSAPPPTAHADASAKTPRTGAALASAAHTSSRSTG